MAAAIDFVIGLWALLFVVSVALWAHQLVLLPHLTVFVSSFLDPG